MGIQDFYLLTKAVDRAGLFAGSDATINLALVTKCYHKSRSQTYRDLKKAQKIGLVSIVPKKRGKMDCASYHVTREGVEFVTNINRELKI